MDAWSGAPIPAKYPERPNAAGAPGSAGLSGEAMPQLPRARRHRAASVDRRWISVAVAADPRSAVRQVLQGGGNMPAYGKNLNPAEMAALVSFLDTLHPANQAPARDAARQISEQSEHPNTQTGKQ